jgi:L-ornithine N5-oxygenase
MPDSESSKTRDRAAADAVDLVGLGFGPSNLALAVALRDEVEAGAAPLTARFFESRDSFAWHPGMLFPNARMQVSFLKDLATLRDPRSRFSFLYYLWSQGRLSEFINLSDFRPSRVEFTDYLRWAAAQLADGVKYGHDVLGVAPVAGRDGRVEMLEVRVRETASGREATCRARNVVLAAGREPRIPDRVKIARGGRVLHSNDFLPAFHERFVDRAAPHRFVIAGEGQSGAEILEHLIGAYPNASVTAAMRDIAYRPMDDSPFVNECFFPERVDDFFRMSDERRRSLLTNLKNTNYAVVDLQLIERLYRTLYEARVAGRSGLTVLPFSELVAAQEHEDGVRVELRNRQEERTETLDADALVLATGFTTPKRHPLLEGLAEWLEVDDGGRYRVGRDYRIAAREGFAPGVFLQGYCQHTHGIADTLLSIVSIRAGEILSAIRQPGAERGSAPRRARQSGSR